jgi:ABC-2 type transport system ATP-binding protein
MPIIQVQSLSKAYRVSLKSPGFLNTLKHFFNRQHKNIQAVDNVSFDIQPGEFVGFLGPNGAGKTTTLKMLTGLIHPTSGSVQVAGFTPFERRHDFLKSITMVMGQKQQLIWDLPVLDSLRINAAVYEIPEPLYEDRLQKLSKMLDIGAELRQPVRKLSLGQRMKAELLAALIHEPKILFLDEPTLGLDVNAQAAVRDFLRSYNQQTGATIILTSHYMADIVSLCKRVLVIDHGKLIHDGSLDEILEKFAPYRQITADLDQPPPPGSLDSLGVEQKLQGQSLTILVKRDALPATVTQMLSTLSVKDLTITDPPIEEVIAKLFSSSSRPIPSPSGGGPG